MSLLNGISLLEQARRMRECPPSIDPVLSAAVDHYSLCQSLAGAFPKQFGPVSKSLKSLRAELEGRLLEAGADTASPKIQEIPRISIDALQEPEFKTFITEPCPVVIDTAAASTVALQEWSPSFFKNRFEAFPCFLATDTRSDIAGTIADAIEDILHPTAEPRYAHNIANIFNEHPDLEAQLELDRFLPYLGPGRHIGTHLFLGAGTTGTRFHCANNLNVFFNVYGEKQWFFAHPRHTFWMYGVLHDTGSYGDSPVDHQKTAAEQRKKFPLYEQVPVYSARLAPGDVLINPPWWWHAVDNVTNGTIGCAARWLPYRIRESNPTFSLAQRLVPHAQEVMKTLLSNPHARITDDLYRNNFDPVRKEK